MAMNLLDCLRDFLPDEVKREMEAIEDEMHERFKHVSFTTNGTAAIALVWCVREVLALRRRHEETLRR